mmetsp:Transcript_1213/g.2462  ORF Transcript_1213/g.2462 Transcript_1213/m.2462 type:complete len:251 (+) Transcript_1213:1431-2183(+)
MESESVNPMHQIMYKFRLRKSKRGNPMQLVMTMTTMLMITATTIMLMRKVIRSCVVFVKRRDSLDNNSSSILWSSRCIPLPLIPFVMMTRMGAKLILSPPTASPLLSKCKTLPLRKIPLLLLLLLPLLLFPLSHQRNNCVILLPPHQYQVLSHPPLGCPCMCHPAATSPKSIHHLTLSVLCCANILKRRWLDACIVNTFALQLSFLSPHLSAFWDRNCHTYPGVTSKFWCMYFVLVVRQEERLCHHLLMG